MEPQVTAQQLQTWLIGFLNCCCRDLDLAGEWKPYFHQFTGLVRNLLLHVLKRTKRNLLSHHTRLQLLGFGPSMSLVPSKRTFP